MDKTTVMLPLQLKKKAQAAAKREGISLGAFVRRSVEHEVTHPSVKPRPEKERSAPPQSGLSPTPDERYF